MALLDFLRPQAQAPGAMQQPSGLARLLAPEVALPMAAGLLGNQGNMGNLALGFGLASPALQQQKELQAQTAQTNKTLDYFRTNAPEYAAMIEGGMPVGDAWGAYTKQKFAKPDGANIFNAGGGNLYDADKGEWLSAPGGGVDPVAGLAPVWMKDQEGNWRIGQLRKDGSMALTDMPEGMSAVPPYDISEQKAAGTNAGKGQGEAIEAYRSMTSMMPGLQRTIAELDSLSEQATYTLGGQALDWGMRQSGMEPRESAVARAKYIATVDNQVLPLLRDTFGAQFTVAEGERLRATLGRDDLSPKEKQAVLKSFIDQKVRSIEALALRGAGGGASAPVEQGDSGVVDYTDYFGR